MSRWFRMYDDALDDEKINLLSDKSFRGWFKILCIASKNDGVLPDLPKLAFRLRISEERTSMLLDELYRAMLIDEVEMQNGPMTYSPHNWKRRQYKSDVSTDRVKHHRKRLRNVSSGVSETPPDTDTDNRSSEANASGAEAPDHRKRLFDEGLAKLASLTGKGPDACRSFVGKCLKAAGDDAVTVLGLIEEAERNRVVDPSAWIAARLKGPENGQARSGIIQAADDLRRKIASFDGPAGGGQPVRGGAGSPAIRLLPNG